MMAHHRFLVAAAAAFSTSAAAVAADRIAVLRAGEAEELSWVEVDVEDAAFLVEKTGERQIDFVSPDEDWDFDLSALGAVARRVVGAREVDDAAASRLRFLLACDCSYAAVMRAGVLKIEFRDPAAFESSTLSPEANSERNGSRFAPVSAPGPRPRRSASAGPSVDPAAEENPVAPPASPGADLALAEEGAGGKDEEVRLARRKLLEQLSRAAEQGLLDFASPEAEKSAPPPPEREETPDAVVETIVEAAPVEEEAPLPETAASDMDIPAVEAPPRPKDPVELSVRARTSIDKAFRADRRDTIVAQAPCVEDFRLDARYWPGAGTFLDEVSAFNRALVNEFDEPNPEAVTGLTRLYVSWGFGREALQTIDLYGEAIDDAALLRDLAYIVDGEPPTIDGPISAAGPCSGPVALWFKAAGLRGDDELSPPGVFDAMLEALETSPGPLRALLGPMLIADRLDAGDVEMAARINRSLSRMQEDFGPGLDLARARLLAANGDVEAAEALFGRLASKTLPESQDALLRLLDSRIERGAPVSEGLTEALAEAAFLARGGVRERDLKIAEIRATSLHAGLPAALAKVSDALQRRPISRPILEDAGHAVLESAEAGENALAYSQAVLDYAPNISRDAAGDAARVKAATELTKIGLANAAIEMLAPALGRGAAATRLAAARAEASLGRHESALETIAGLTSAEAVGIRADAFEALGRMADARAAAETLSGDADAGDRAFRIGDWSGARDGSDRSRRILAAYMAGADGGGDEAEPLLDDVDQDAADAFLTPPAVAEDVTLRDAQSVRDASETVRAIIEEALGDG